MVKKLGFVQWCRENDVWYLKIPLEIPEVCIKEAQAVYDEGFFIKHPYGGGDAWCAAMHSFVEGGTDTSLGWRHIKNPDEYGFDAHVTWGWTEIAEVAPETKRWLQDFTVKEHKYRRLRYILLKPGGRISGHADSNETREKEGRRRNVAGTINLAITQPDNCYLRRVDTKEELPFENCTGFWFDNGINHEAYNASNENRFHFIVEGGLDIPRKEGWKKSLTERFGSDAVKEIDPDWFIRQGADYQKR